MSQYSIILKGQVSTYVIQGLDEKIILRFVEAYGNGDPACVYNGKSYDLDMSAFEIYRHEPSLKIPAKVFDLWAGNRSPERPVDLINNVSEEYFTGPFGTKTYGDRFLALKRNSTDPNISQSTKNSLSMDTKPIFISHASKDKEIVNVFVDEYLERGLKVDAHSQIFYTSSHVTGIAPGSNWRESIRQCLINSEIVFCFISEHYSQSQYCIAELGAAWAFQKTIIPIQIPPKQHVGGGELYAVIQMINGNDRQALSRLRDELIDNHKVGERIASSAQWEKALAKFVDCVAAAETENGKK